MDILNFHIDYVNKEALKTAEEINAEKIAAITEFEGRLDACPQQWVLVTKRFIKLVKDNIDSRDKLINEFRVISSVDEPKRVLDIVHELEDLDGRDIRAVDFYNTVMDEYLD